MSLPEQFKRALNDPRVHVPVDLGEKSLIYDALRHDRGSPTDGSSTLLTIRATSIKPSARPTVTCAGGNASIALSRNDGCEDGVDATKDVTKKGATN